MAFGNRNLLKEKQETEIPSSEKPQDGSFDEADSYEEESHLDFLNPKKNARKDSLNDPYQEEMLKKTAFQYTLKTLNAIKIVSPIITALMHKPGVDAPSEEMSASFRLLIKEISNLSGIVCEKIGVDPSKEKNYWVRNVLEKSFAEILKDQWIANEKIDTEKVVALIQNVVDFSEGVAEKIDYDEIPDKALLKIASIKAMMPIINEAKTNFDLYRDLEADIEPIMTKLFEKSAYAVNRLADNYAESSDRAKIFYMIMQEAGNLYASSWHAEGERFLSIMDSYGPEKLQKALDKYKNSGGFPIDKMEMEFDKYFDKMIVITEKLVTSQKQGIEKKLKK